MRESDKTFLTGGCLIIGLWLMGAILSLGSTVGLIWFVCWLLHHFHVFN